MKRILFVAQNMAVGGIQTSLLNLLKELCAAGEYEIHLFCFGGGSLMAQLPEMANVDLNSYVAKTKHPLFDKCGDIFENYMSEIMTNGMDPEEGWKLMVEEINDTLADQ